MTTPLYGFGSNWIHSKLRYIIFTNKDSKVFIPLFIKIEYTWEKFKWKNWIVQIKIIHVLMVMIFHMCTLLCINTLIHNHKCKKCLYKLIQTTWYISLHDYFLQIWLALGATNSKPNEYKQSTKIWSNM